MISQCKRIFTKSFFMALAGACLMVAMDLTFSSFAPKSYLNINSDMPLIKAALYVLDGVLAHHVFFLFFLISSFLGRFCAWGLLAAGMVLYLTSWLTFLLIGEFLGVEGIRFVAHNIKDIVWLLSQISKGYLLALTGLLLSPLAVYLLFNKIKKEFKGFAKVTELNSNILFFVTVLAALVLLVLLFVLPQKISSKNKFHLKFRVSPLATLCFDKQVRDIPNEFNAAHNYLKPQWNKIISWPQFKDMQVQEPKAVPVIVMVVESLRSDVLENGVLMPNLFALTQEGILVKPYTTSTQTDSAWPALLSSQYPMRTDYHYYYPKRINFPRVTIYDVLKYAGFSTAIFSTQNERWGGMYNFLNTETLDVFYDADSSKLNKYAPKEDTGFAKFSEKFRLSGKLDDAQVIDEATRWVNQLKSQKFFIGFNFQRPHYPYSWPEGFQAPFQYCPPQQWVYPLDMLSLVKGRYYNALRYTDTQIGRFIKFLKEKGLYDQSIIVVLGDHGEAFYEHGTAIHGNQIYNETAMTSLVLKGSNQSLPFTLNKVPELMDLAPTITQMLGLSVHPAFQGSSWLDPKPPQKPVFITVNAPFAKQDAIVEDNWKLVKNYRTGKVVLFNLSQDPQERQDVFSSNMSRGRDLLFKLLFWRFKQIEYYAKASLRDNFYPPQFSSN